MHFPLDNLFLKFRTIFLYCYFFNNTYWFIYISTYVQHFFNFPKNMVDSPCFFAYILKVFRSIHSNTLFDSIDAEAFSFPVNRAKTKKIGIIKSLPLNYALIQQYPL